MHTGHGDIHEIGLVDNCEACTYHTDDPFNTLDETMLRNLIVRNYGYRFSKDGTKRIECAPRSYTEAVAMANITNIMEKMGKLFETAPSEMVDYLEDRWRISFDGLRFVRVL